MKDYLLPRSEMLSTHFEHLKTQFEFQSSKFLRIEFLGTVNLLLSITDNLLFDLLIYLFQIALEITG